MTSILWENTAKLFDATSIAGSLNAHLDSFCDGHLSRKAGSQERYQPPQNPPKKQQCKNQECLASYKKKLIACARVRCKRRVDSVAVSPREYLVRQAAKNVINPPKTPQNPPKPTAVYKPWSNYFPVLLCTTKLAQSTSQYYFVLQTLHKALPSTTLYYEACASSTTL